MIRRLAASIALVAALLSVAPALVHAESGGGTDSTTKTAMGKLASGGATNCAIITGGGSVGCWGENNNGQIGIGNTANQSRPASIAGMSATQIAASPGNTCALLADTTVKCWGYNDYGQVGNGANTTAKSPAAVCAVDGCGNGFLTGVKMISMGLGFACAILSNDTVACWGYNNQYQLGFNYMTDPSNRYTSNVPLLVASVSNAVQISSGFAHTCAVITGGSLKCWGQGGDGQLGLGDGNNSSRGANTVTAAGISGVKAVAGMQSATCAIVSDDTVRCWGRNFNSNPSTDLLIRNTPDTMNIAGTAFYAKAIDASNYGACAIETSGSLVCWGSMSGLGDVTTGTNFGAAYTVARVTGFTSVTNVAVGSNSVCATQSGGLKCWGGAGAGVLGNGDETPNSSSTAVNVVVPNPQTITFGSLANKNTADAPFNVSATVDSGATPVFESSTAGVCTVSTADNVTYTVSIVSAGTCTIVASRDSYSTGGNFYSAANPVSQSFTVSNVAPSVTIAAASSVTTTSATLNATVNPAHLSTTTAFEYATRQDMTSAVRVDGETISLAVDLGSTKSLSTGLTGLRPGTTYYARFSATNSIGTSTSAVLSFTTLGGVPTVTTGSPTSVSSGRATLNGVVNANDVTTTVWFTIGQKADLSDGTKIEYRDVTGNAATDVSVSATSLVESARYYYRIEASNSLGAVKGDTKSFTAARPTGISVNDAAEFTNKKQVTIYATGPSGSTQVIVSNDGGFGSAQTFSLTDNYAEIPWTLVASRDERLPKTVYARFVQRFGTQSSNYSDDIILDTTAPVMSSASGSSTSPAAGNVTVQAVRATAKGGVKLTVRAKDANSGIGKVQIKGSSGGAPVDVSTGSPKATSRTVKVNTTKKKLWVRVVDRAGNVSKWVTVTVK